MRIVLFSRVPKWYSFKNERLASHLAAEGFEIAGVVVETTSTLKSLREWTKKLGWGVFVSKLMQRLPGGKTQEKTAGMDQEITEKRASISPDVFHFKSHNSPECIEKVRSLKPDVIVLRGCGILKKPILEVPNLGVINPHYALLPDFRGMDVTEWSVLSGAPVAVSVHTVNSGVDTGVVLKSEKIEPGEEDSVGSLRDKSARLAVKLLRDALIDLRNEQKFPEDKMNDGGKQYFQMHWRLKNIANRRLQKLA